MGFPRFAAQDDCQRLRLYCSGDVASRRLLFCWLVSTRICVLFLLSTSIACTTQLAQLPGAPHERASFNAPQLAAQMVAEAPSSLFKSPIGGSSGAVGTSHKAVSSTLNRESLTADADNSLLQQDQHQSLLKDESDAGQSNPLEEHLSIDAVGAPIDSLLFALASNAGFELNINGELNQLVTIKIVQRPINVLLDELAEQASFSWVIKDKRITVWTGAAYGYSYPINYLNIDRRTQSSVGLATQVGTINAANSNGSVANSSETRVENVSEHHFWQSLRTDVEGLINQDFPASDDGSPRALPSPAQFSINREAGLLTLFATPAVHQALQRYLDLLHDSTQRQVLIEATVVEVALSESFEAGVDWQVLAQGINGFSAAQVLVGAPLLDSSSVDRLAAPAGLVSLVQQGSNGDVGATLSLLEQFGDVRILSRPRIIALNNQSSVLKVVDNRVYFTVNVERRQTDTKDEIVTETEIHTVPVGLVMNVTPQISRHGAVMLNVRPTLSRILGFVNDPNPELAQANVRNSVPEIQVREMESMLQVQSGNVAVIGGLMQDTTEDNDARLPGLGQLPIIKYFFSQRGRKRRQTELLIVLRPTVLSHSTMAAQR